MITKEKIKELSESFFEEVKQIREHIHANPELSFHEYETSAYVTKKLDEYGIPYEKGFVKTGIVATLHGKNPEKKTIALRTELDALPITEKNTVSYKSLSNGVMHACGHDVHTSTALGVAKMLNLLKDQYEGRIHIFFQPGEEKLPGGASLMIDEGVLLRFAPSAVFAHHVMPSIEAGGAGFRNGMYMASADEIYITVKGKGGHAAMKENTLNPLLIASELLLAFEEMAKKDSPPDIPTVLAFGRMMAEGATNIIPDEVKIEGTLRTMNEEWRSVMHKKIEKLAKDVAGKAGGSSEVNIIKGYPFLINDDEITNRARKAAEEYLGHEKVEELPLRMTADDFAFFSQSVPGCYYRLGISNKAKGITAGVHTATFDIDNKALITGMGLMTWILLNELRA